MNVLADGEERSLGSGPSCSLRLSPDGVSVCDVRGYIPKEEGRLLLRRARLAHSMGPADIEVKGETVGNPSVLSNLAAPLPRLCAKLPSPACELVRSN